nr:MAG TPA: hypothetical protein [Herelleviridae sp.]
MIDELYANKEGPVPRLNSSNTKPVSQRLVV